MATHNYVQCLGVVRKDVIIRDGPSGRTAMAALTVAQNERDDVQRIYTLKSYSSPILITQEEKLVDEVATWNVNDVIFATGFLATKDATKKSKCPECGEVNLRAEACINARSGGTLVFFYPIFLEKVASCGDQGFAHAFLKKRLEISNRVILVGNLTKDPIRGSVYNQNYTRFQIACNRKYCAKGAEQIAERTDYPWIYSYGKKAEDNFKALHEGSLVMVDGAFQTRKYKETYKCQHCGCEYEVPGQCLEVLAYNVEFLYDCDFDSLLEGTTQTQ